MLPTAPVGPGDRRPTPTGKIIVDLLRGRMPATLGGGMNVVPVEDVAAAHVLALERGRPGERYIAGGVNLTLAELWRTRSREPPGGRSEPCGFPTRSPPPRHASTRCASASPGGTPAIPLEGVRMGRLEMYSSSAKAIDRARVPAFKR